jgi:hypothetical protein
VLEPLEPPVAAALPVPALALVPVPALVPVLALLPVVALVESVILRQDFATAVRAALEPARVSPGRRRPPACPPLCSPRTQRIVP